MNKRIVSIVFTICLMVLLISCTPQVSENESVNGAISHEIPEIKRDTNLGAELPLIDYESEDRIIFSNYLGIFVYDLENSEMVRSFKPSDSKLKIGTQGDTTSIIQVDNIKEIITIHNVGSELLDYYYEYDINEDKLYKYPIEELPTNIKQHKVTGQMNTSNWIAWDMTYSSNLTGKTYYPFRNIIN